METKKARGVAKGVVTRKINEITDLMTDESNVDEVNRKANELKEAFDKFQVAHRTFHSQLTEREAIEESTLYHDSVFDQVEHLQENVDVWLTGIETTRLINSFQEQVRPDDSVSSVSRASRSSRTSQTSRTSSASARAKAAARKAILGAEAATLKRLHQIEEQELKLRQRKTELKLETEMAKAEAEELVYAQAEEREIAESHFLIEERQAKMSSDPMLAPNEIEMDVTEDKVAPIANAIESENLPEQSTPFIPTLPPVAKLEEPTRQLNPEAPAWRGKRAVEPTRAQNSISVPHSTPVTPPKGDIQLLLHQQQEAIMALTLPQPEVPVFSGDPIGYCEFVRAFENLVERKTSSPSTRLYYLLQYTSGSVQDLVRSCLTMPDDIGYKEARRLLAERYGQPYNIATAYVDRVINGAPIRAEDGPSLQKFSILLTSCRNTLNEIGYLNRLENPDSLRKIVERLPYPLRLKWRDLVDAISQKEGRDPNLKDISEFVEARSRATNHPIFGKVQTEQRPPLNTRTNTKNRRDGKTFAIQGLQQSFPQLPNNKEGRKELKCPSCKRNHWLSQCDVFKKLSLSNRYQFVRANKLCLNCLVPGHFVQDCPKRSFCRIQGCTKKHSTYLHVKETPPSQNGIEAGQTEPPATANAAQASNSYLNVNASQVSSGSVVGLSIVPVKVKVKGTSKKVLTYAFLDSGSNTSFCTEDLLRKLATEGKKTSLSLTTMQTSNQSIECSSVNLEVSDLSEQNLVELPMVYSTPSLPVSPDTVGTQEDVNRWPHLKGIKLQSIESEVGLLIGSDAPRVLQPKEFRESKDGGPFATRTIFGWVVNGPLGRKESKVPTANFIDTSAKLSKQFEDFCNLEFNDSSYEPQASMSQNDRKALHIMDGSAKLSNAHYEIALPWKNDPPLLMNNKSQARQRLHPLKKRFTRDSALHKKYRDFMDDLINKGYARKVSKKDLDNSNVWYLPHHAVFHPQKPDKVRVVFDCSAKFLGTSLNDQLLQGPDLTNTLVGVLTRFRQEHIAFMSDIESMFYQVRVPPSDCNYLRFLWWPDGDLNKDPEEYQMLVHLFGGASSPSCANFALKKTAEDNKAAFDAITVETVKRNFYVDDCLKSVATNPEAIRLVGQLREMLSKGGFRLTKWISNSRDVISCVPETERAPSVKDLDLSNNPALTERALGVQWNVQKDTFSYKIAEKERPITRRGMLSIICSVYDPLGFVSPCILPAKAIQQDLCLKGLGWDDQIPEPCKQKWQSWLEDLPKLEQFEIPRCFKPPNCPDIQQCELHHFSDASSQGYGAVSYLRQTDIHGEVYCSLIMAKSRLAPLKAMTIPRMELSAAVLATRLDRMIKQELDMTVHSSTFWTDSTCVLRYIENKDRRFQIFVANRVSAILDQSTAAQWRYIETTLNPADEASRGMTVDELLMNQRWKQGPPFLKKAEHSWPKRPENLGEISDNDPEVKKGAETFANEATHAYDYIGNAMERTSSWSRLKKIIAWILRYKNILRKRSQHSNTNKPIKLQSDDSIITPLSVSEVNVAENEIIKYVQRQTFKDELTTLSGVRKSTEKTANRNNLKKNSSIYKLDPVLENGLLRVGGRLEHAPIENDAKHPIILPKKHHVTKLIVEYFHHASGHSGVEYTLSLIRQRYWILGARNNVRNIVNMCFSCRRRQAPVMQQKMASLPQDRVTPSKPPFTYVGVDLFGPFTVRRGRTTAKRYGALFTCLSIRAVHIEIVHSMDTESFINALRRFIARRGRPEEIRSDNGGNFVKGEKELRQALQEWNQNQIHEFLLQQEIRWTFNPPAASHHGGVWERCIRTVRKVMKALLKQQVLDDEGLSTLMCEVESIVNGRPITKVSDDAKDLNALTPSHLLLLRAGSAIPPGVFSKDDNYSCRRWRQVQYLSNVFWRRWTREYLPSLQQRQRWNKQQLNLAVNDIVLLLDENLPRSVWPLGRVLEVYHNRRDGLVRSAKVKTRTSELVRPIDKIVLLETAEIASKE